MLLSLRHRKAIAVAYEMLHGDLVPSTRAVIQAGLEELRILAEAEFWSRHCCPTCLIERYGEVKAKEVLERLQMELHNLPIPLSD